MQPHARVQAGLAQAAREPRRVDHRARVPVPGPAQEGGEIELAAHRGRVELSHVVTETAGGFDLLVQVIELPGLSGDGQLAYWGEAAVDAAVGHRLADLGQVLRAQFFQQRHLGREARQAVADPVGEAGGAEAAVPAGRRPAGRGRLEEHDLRRRVPLPGQQRRPQPGELAADHGEIGAQPPGQRGRGSGGAGLAGPERLRECSGQCRDGSVPEGGAGPAVRFIRDHCASSCSFLPEKFVACVTRRW